MGLGVEPNRDRMAASNDAESVTQELIRGRELFNAVRFRARSLPTTNVEGSTARPRLILTDERG